MNVLPLKTDLSAEALKEAYQRAPDKRTAQRYQALYLRKQGMSPPQIAQVVGRHAETVRKWIKKFNRAGLAALRYRPPQAGPKRRLQEEHWQQIDRWLEGPAPGGSARWTRQILQEKLQQEWGIQLSVTRISELLHERGYRRVRPRPQHQERDLQAVADFKKVWRTS